MRRAQSGIEYIVITGFALAVLAPVIYLLVTSLRGYEAETTSAQTSAIARQLLSTAERVQHYGPPSRLTFSARVPAGIASAAIRRNDPATGCTKCTEILFTLSTGMEIAATTGVDVHSNKAPTIDAGVTTYTFDPSFYAPGVRTFQLEAFPDYVDLRQT